MAANIECYMLRYNQCQCYKPASHFKATLKLQETPPGPWENVGVNLITQLLCDTKLKMDSVAVYIDHYFDQCHLMPVDFTVIIKSIAEVYYTDIFQLHSLPKKIFSDCESQFAAQYMQALYKHIGIKIRLTTTYYSEGNGKVECKN